MARVVGLLALAVGFAALCWICALVVWMSCGQP
jgi:hypothetical protein